MYDYSYDLVVRASFCPAIQRLPDSSVTGWLTDPASTQTKCCHCTGRGRRWARAVREMGGALHGEMQDGGMPQEIQ